MTVFWSQEEVLGDLADKFTGEADRLPAEGSRVNIVKVDLVPDPDYKTSAWLVLYQQNGDPIRFRMKESTARPLQAIIRSLVMRNNEYDYQAMRRGIDPREWQRQYMGGFTS